MRDIRDFVVPFGVMAIIGMMVFPLPLALLDLLLICNITLSVILLLSALSVSEPERFTTLPTVLLLATLFRLGLNIATTRQLLGQGVAPEVVTAFGEFVVGGNFVVGSVIFLIVTLVQFLVIAKGAERVAEVAARFTLDAMPGKQMAIDADIRAGILSLTDAREKRRDLQRESRLYGALDGAMKFVKGDTIASLVITVLNIGGGFVIGIFQRGLGVEEALRRYTLFTIGDGLVSQVPALLTAVAAGIAVTRVTDREGSSVGRELFAQLGRDPQTLASAGCILGVLAFTPGLPAFPLVVLGVALLLGAGAQRRKMADAGVVVAENTFRPSPQAVCTLRMGQEATAILQQEGRLLAGIRDLKERFYRRWGIVLGEIDGLLGDGDTPLTVWVLIRGVPIASMTIDKPGVSNAIATDRVLMMLGSALDEHRADFVDDLQTRMLFEIHEPYCEALINTVTTKHTPVTAVTRILRELVAEGIALHAIPTILQAIAEAAADTVNGVRLPLPSDLPGSAARHSGVIAVERRSGEGLALGSVYAVVRHALRRQIVAMQLGADTVVRALELDSEVDRVLSSAVLHDVALHPELVRRIGERLTELVETTTPKPAVLVASCVSRPVLSRLARSARVSVGVLSFDEIADTVLVCPTGVFGLEGVETFSMSPNRDAELESDESDDEGESFLEGAA